MTQPSASIEQARRMQAYYQVQAGWYDATRWSFLFGRRRLLQLVPLDRDTEGTLLEVGCGTGYNLTHLAQRFPRAAILGLDVSDDMLRQARRRIEPYAGRIQLRAETFGESSRLDASPQLILFSYALTMINPQWPNLIEAACHHLAPGGYLALVDFHDTRYAWFRRHMAKHHVRMTGHLLPALQARLTPVVEEVRPAYGGLWRYVLFVGQKR